MSETQSQVPRLFQLRLSKILEWTTKTPHFLKISRDEPIKGTEVNGGKELKIQKKK